MKYVVLFLAALLFAMSAFAAEPAPQAPAEQPLTLEQLWKAQGSIETQRDMLINQANAQVDQLNQRLKAIADEIAKLKGGGQPVKGK